MILRLYSFVHACLSPLQKGLQTAHAVTELMRYEDLMVLDWAEFHKTIIIKNGGDCQNLNLIVKEFKKLDNSYPWSSFREDKETLNGAITAVVIILPYKFYEKQKELPVEFTDWEKRIKTKLIDGTALAQ